VVGDGEQGAVKEGVSEDGGTNAGGGVVVVGGVRWVRYANAGRFDGEEEEGVEIRVDGGWGGATKEDGEKCPTNGNIHWREVFGHV